MAFSQKLEKMLKKREKKLVDFDLKLSTYLPLLLYFPYLLYFGHIWQLDLRALADGPIESVPLVSWLVGIVGTRPGILSFVLECPGASWKLVICPGNVLEFFTV